MNQESKEQQPAAAATEEESANGISAEAESELTAASESIESNSDIDALREELEQLRIKTEENWKLYLQARADAENIRRRSERDLENARKYALEKFITELLPVKDSLEMGLAAVTDSTELAKLREGTELTLKMFNSTVAKFGVEEVNPIGEKFNPELHEAMAMQPSAQAKPNTVLQVIQKGYRLNRRLVRPAMVIVAQAAQNV